MPSQPLANTGLRARLLRQLDDSATTLNGTQLPCFAERLSRLFGLGDTMTLDAAIGYRAKQPGTPQGATVERLTEELATICRALVQRIRGFGSDLEFDGEPELEAALNAWLALQRKVAANSRQLRDKVRKSMKDQGPKLAHLAELDAVFDQTMAGYTAQCFSHIPKVLEQRFEHRSTTPGQSPTPATTADWFHRYCEEAQSLLLAELDVRLEPVLGLLEACHKEVNNTP